MRITSKGQVTIPIEVRQRLGLLPHTEIEFRIDGKLARIVKATPRSGRPDRSDMLLRRLRGSATVKMTTDEIMALTRGE